MFVAEVDRFLFLVGDRLLSDPNHTMEMLRQAMDDYMMGDRITAD